MDGSPIGPASHLAVLMSRPRGPWKGSNRTEFALGTVSGDLTAAETGNPLIRDAAVHPSKLPVYTRTPDRQFWVFEPIAIIALS